jgi:hypothetical protein
MNIADRLLGFKNHVVCTTDKNGNKYWRLCRKLHREDGPAVEWADGTKFWYINGKLHREDGPAVQFDNGVTAWFINGKQVTKDYFIRWQIAQRCKPYCSSEVLKRLTAAGYFDHEKPTSL